MVSQSVMSTVYYSANDHLKKEAFYFKKSICIKSRKAHEKRECHC